MWCLMVASAHAWEVRTTDAGDPVHWTGFPVDWDRAPGAVPLPAGGDAAVRDAFAAWRVPGTGVAFDRTEAPSEVPELAADGRNHVWMVDPWPLEDDLLALSSVWYDPSGDIVTFDVRVNGEQPWSTDGSPDGFDLRGALTHEVGHVLGLEHSEDPDAVMYADLGPGDTTRRALTADDAEGLRSLYDATAAPPVAACETCPPSRALAGLLGALSVLLRRRPASGTKEETC